MNSVNNQATKGEVSVADVEAAVKEAVALAIEEHRRLGFPITVERDGEIVTIPAEEIPPYTPRPRPVQE